MSIGIQRDSISLSKNGILSFVLGILAFCLVFITQTQHSTFQVDFKRHLIPPPPMIERISFGYSEVIADSLWIRSLQDFSYCDHEIAKNVCRNNSWLYKMMDSITNLSPNFRIAYAAGALALTVVITDVEGATKIFEKGVKAFPRDWPILYRAAYHYLYEVNDKKKAAELLVQAGQNGAPPWVFTLAGRLYSDSGHIELAESLLQEMIRNEQDPTLIKRLQDKINSMKNADSSK
ncbi:tetratricopeptide repeat protein [Bdellovibrio sp. HCB-162]|uniref:tetratricopeptide repeat protein n=1 Tax=Bdellovibrio sp. HCB-162 TaxID=3394234 RepID=UPI0039BD5E6E